ncbi:MAG: aminotransferase class V-fold PLP-dependent enzyme [SAR324 cluster bacterium]|nr:aminotransferase class V-fold PLP-dependent enzyme [SAR324 cluster bacterium]
MSVYKNLGIRPVINAFATLTRLGGSLMPVEVTEAMLEASKNFLELDELQKRVGDRLAVLTRNEAAYVSSGAAAGLTLAAAACVTGTDPAAIAQIPNLTGLKNEVIIHRTHRNGYDHAVRQVGVKVVEIGFTIETARWELEQAISPQTAAIFWFQGVMTGIGDLPLHTVIEVAKDHGVPVIVDCAAQLPPVENLWRFTQMGADLAIFSGGKDLRGPQSSGLVLGRRDLIEACAVNASPNHSIGRPMKVGKEEMVGLLTAVELYLNMDHEARKQNCEDIVAAWTHRLKQIPGLTARRDFPNEAGQPLPWCLLTVDPQLLGISRDQIIDRLMAGNPAVAVAPANHDGIHLNPMTLEPGEDQIVIDRLIAVLHQAA